MTSGTGERHEETGEETGEETSATAREGTIWIRPGLTLPGRLDTALFDIDGVLIDTRRSYRLAVMHGSEGLVRATGLEPPAPMVSQDDVAAFKLAGGFNSDWDGTQLFAALWTARLREWRDQPEAQATTAEWAARAAEAARAGRGGVEWVRATFPATAIPSDEAARWAHDEFYWGAALVRELFGHEPLYAPEATGFVHNEEMLLDVELLPALAALGITRLGLITGRLGPEVDFAVRMLAQTLGPEDAASQPWHDGAYGRSPFASVIPATVYAKPDPRALWAALDELNAKEAIYVGDTADDLDVVLRYRRELQAHDPALPLVLAVMVARGDTAGVYQRRGADIVLSRVTDLPAALRRLS
ncbi:MAG TPA: HAD family hydrolase [Ktedonobacterales bacterium]